MLRPIERQRRVERSAVFVPDDVMKEKRMIHETLCELRGRGFITQVDLYTNDARIVSEFGDPLALGRENAAKISASFARGVQTTSFWEWNEDKNEAQIGWSSKFVESAVQGQTLAKLQHGLVSQLIIKNITIQGIRTTDSIANTRTFLVNLLTSANSYDALAQLVGNRLAAVLPESNLEKMQQSSDFSLMAQPNANALGSPEFEAYDKLQTTAQRLVNHLETALDQPPAPNVYTNDFTIYGLANETLAENFVTVSEALRFSRGTRSALLATGLLREEQYSVIPSAFNGTALTMNFSYQAQLGGGTKASFRAQVVYDLDYESTTTAQVTRLSLNGVELEPSIAQARLAKFAADFLPTYSWNLPSQKQNLIKQDTSFPKLTPQDCQARLRATAAIYENLPQIFEDADSFVHAIGLSEKVVIRGLLKERLLTGKTDVRSALRAAKTLIRLTSLPSSSKTRELRVDSIEIQPDAKLAVTFRILSNGLTSPTLVVTCILTFENAAVSEILITYLRPAGSDGFGGSANNNLPSRLAAVLQTASDIGRSSFPVVPSSSSERKL